MAQHLIFRWEQRLKEFHINEPVIIVIKLIIHTDIKTQGSYTSLVSFCYLEEIDKIVTKHTQGERNNMSISMCYLKFHVCYNVNEMWFAPES